MNTIAKRQVSPTKNGTDILEAPPKPAFLDRLLGVKNGNGAHKVNGHGASAMVPADLTLFHITHWKAGSQWIGGMLQQIFTPDFEPAENFEAQVFTRPVKPGKVYRCVYVTRQEYLAVAPRGARYFVVLRDLRDTLVSTYFSIRYSHAVTTPSLEKMRVTLSNLEEEEGLRYLMECNLTQSAVIQRSWLEAGVPFYKFEDFLKDAPGQLEMVFRENWGVKVARPAIEMAAARHSFEKLSRGRQNGEEDVKSHYRKGVAGDWRTHFTPRITERFKYLYNDLLVGAGYERDGNW